jgi:glycerate 2-kinase
VCASKRLEQSFIRREGQIIRNGGSPANRNARRVCLEALDHALGAVDPYRCVTSRMRLIQKQLVVDRIQINLCRLRSVFVLAVGKASASMMRATLQCLGDIPIRGILIAPRGQELPTFDDRIESFLSGHPIPTQAGVRASYRVVQAVGGLREDDLFLCLISGGASATLPAPAEGITLQDKITITDQLVRSEANIHEINTVRRHISRLKGGRLVELCRSSRVISLIISDVPGNYLPDIGSGLTAEDPTTYHDAIEVLRRHHLWEHAPSRVKDILRKGVRGVIPETPKPGSPSFHRVDNIIIADNRTACAAAQRALRKRNLRASILTTSVEMQARDLGQLLASVAHAARLNAKTLKRSRAMIVGGECVVRVTGKGKGGRNQEVGLSAVEGVRGLDGTVVAALGTDGIDGNTNVAGAIVDGNTASRASRRRLDPSDYLARNDSGSFFRLLGDCLVTGPTGTNVADIYLLISLQ